MDCMVRDIISSALPRESEEAVSPSDMPLSEEDEVRRPVVLTSVVSESVPTSVDIESVSAGGGGEVSLAF